MGKLIQFVIKKEDEAVYENLVTFLENQQWVQGFKAIEEKEDESIEKIITRILRFIGIPAHVKGYGYLRDSILFVLEHENAMESITKIVYPYVAKKNDTTSVTVERAMRHAIERGWISGGKEKFCSYFGYEIAGDKPRPSNSEFIASVADYIYTENKDKINLCKKNVFAVE